MSSLQFLKPSSDTVWSYVFNFNVNASKLIQRHLPNISFIHAVSDKLTITTMQNDLKLGNSPFLMNLEMDLE